jgi:hypothetical protein
MTALSLFGRLEVVWAAIAVLALVDHNRYRPQRAR